MGFKTVEWVRQVRDRYHEQTKNLSPEEKREFYKKLATAEIARAKETIRRRKQ